MTAGVTPALRDAAMRWIADDVDAGDRAELQRMLASSLAGDAAAADELATRMAGPLRFGTAGLRGPLRAGPAGMNRAVVLRTSAGLANWLAGQGRTGTVVIGRDARHRSEEFAADAAGVFGAAGFDTVALPRPLPTPVLAFAARRLGAVAGVQITASHNPAADNGYKIYTDGGTQIAPPTDAGIEAAITAAPPAVAVCRDGPVRVVDVLDAYLQRVAGLPRGTARTLRVVATPLHGVGGSVLVAALARAGFTDVHLVAEQAEPDPTFPTVSFPNPEEPGATDALLTLAAELDADLAVALDPDADRCALGTRGHDGTWRMLRGDETGVLLAEHLLSTLDQPNPLVATSLVSSSLLRSVAAAHGARYAETRTGFKWLMAQLRARPPADLDGCAVQAQDLLHHPQQPDNTVALRGDGFRVMVRPSGTEPKLKVYLEVVAPVPTPDQLATAQETARRRLAALREATSTALHGGRCGA